MSSNYPTSEIFSTCKVDKYLNFYQLLYKSRSSEIIFVKIDSIYDLIGVGIDEDNIIFLTKEKLNYEVYKGYKYTIAQKIVKEKYD